MKMSEPPLSAFLQQQLVCPRDHRTLCQKGSFLSCAHGHRYPIVEGVPVLLRDDREQTIGIARDSLQMAQRVATGEVTGDPFYTSTLGISEEEKRGVLNEVGLADSAVDPVVKYLVGATNGILYKHLIGSLSQYPIPELRLPPGRGKRLLDIGCNWGRWSIAAARLGYCPVGIDPSLGAVLAARRVCQHLDLQAEFLVADARYLPFVDRSFDVAFSYSVLQHLSKIEARRSFEEVGRVLRSDGTALIQMPNRWGARCLFHQIRRLFREPTGFEVRYWSLSELRQVATAAIAPPLFSVDCFFGIGLQAKDLHLMPWKYRALIQASELLRRLSQRLSMLIYVADSVYFECVKH